MDDMLTLSAHTPTVDVGSASRRIQPELAAGPRKSSLLIPLRVEKTARKRAVGHSSAQTLCQPSRASYAEPKPVATFMRFAIVMEGHLTNGVVRGVAWPRRMRIRRGCPILRWELRALGPSRREPNFLGHRIGAHARPRVSRSGTQNDAKRACVRQWSVDHPLFARTSGTCSRNRNRVFRDGGENVIHQPRALKIEAAVFPATTSQLSRDTLADRHLLPRVCLRGKEVGCLPLEDDCDWLPMAADLVGPGQLGCVVGPCLVERGNRSGIRRGGHARGDDTRRALIRLVSPALLLKVVFAFHPWKDAVRQ